MRRTFRILTVCGLLLLAGCSGIPEDAFRLTPTSLKEREMQTRIYEEVSEAQILSTSVAIIQDLGAQIVESESALGLIVGHKNRDATSPTQVAGAALAFMLTGAMPTIDKEQKIKFSLVASPASPGKDGQRWKVRLTIQRLVWNTRNQLDRVEGVKNPEVYQAFFIKLDKALFLEKQI